MMLPIPPHKASGQALVEYGLVLSLISAVCLLSVYAFGSGVNNMFTNVSTQLMNADVTGTIMMSPAK